MVLAAGRGERMRPLTDHTPKPLLTVKGKSLIDWHLENLSNHGAHEIVINHAWLGEKISAHIQQSNYPQLSIRLSEEKVALETAGGLRQAMSLMHIEDYFFAINGDVFCPDFPFEKINGIIEDLRKNRSQILAHLFLIKNPSHNADGDFCLKNGHVSDKNLSSESYTFSGAGIYHQELLKGIKIGEVAKLAPILRNAMTNSQVSGELLKVDWADVGTPERLAELNK
jgi:N-acetyl-alpha-D-muramate 1-phosphate uridylyltransferase